MVFLSYPKYYKNGQGKLVPVQTALALSSDPAWDFEVTQGNWHLKVKKDGTIQAEHEGDAFTYKFNSLGTGRGSGFKPFELGEADFSRFIVTGDTIRWSDVFKDIDLSVRYIHDILKVDVIVKNAFMVDLKAEAKAGKLDKNDYLTARFDIPQVLITSKAKQNGQDKDLYAEALDVEQPVYFEKDGKVVHKLRPVEAYLLDAQGEPVYHAEKPIRSAQTWNLKANAPGVAEMSALIADLAELPEGDVVIDPSTYFGWLAKDTMLLNTNPNYIAGYNDLLQWLPTWHMMTAWSTSEFDLPNGAVIRSAKVRMYITNLSPGFSKIIRGHIVSEKWDEGATWNTRWYSPVTAWQYSGGINLAAPTLGGKSTKVEAAGWNEFDVSGPFKYYFSTNRNDLLDKGFLFRMLDTSGTQEAWVITKENAQYSNLRPQLVVEYGNAKFGMHWPKDNNEAALDKLFLDREFVSNSDFSTTPLINLWDYNYNHTDKIKFLLNFHCGAISDSIDVKFKWWLQEPFQGQNLVAADATKERFGQFVDYRIFTRIKNDLYEHNHSAQLSDIIYGVEIGNEEEDYSKGWGAQGGEAFAEYYVKAAEAIRAKAPWMEIVSGGSIMESRKLDNPAGQRVFIEQFIQRVKTLNYDCLPDTLAIHGYTMGYNPEHWNWSVDYRKEWLVRLEQLYNLCIDYDYLPNFANTEYGFSASLDVNGVGDDSFAVQNATMYSQADFYSREVLMNETMMPHPGIGWRNDFIYHHIKADSYDRDFGFFDIDNGSNRVIRPVARCLFDPSVFPGLSLGNGTNTILQPLQGKISPDLQHRYAICAWKVSNDKEWGAIWEYPWSTWYVYSGLEYREFVVPGDYSGRNIDFYRFNSPSNAIEYRGTINNSEITFDGNNSKFMVPTNESPTFLDLK